MRPTAGGIRDFLDYWMYGVLKSARDLGNTRVFLRQVQEESFRKFMETERLELPPAGDPVSVIRAYSHDFDARGILGTDDVVIGGDRDDVRLEIGAGCPYRSTCRWIHGEGEPIPCFQAIALSEVLRRVCDEDFAWTLRSFGIPCAFTLNPTHMEAFRDGI
jgi:hypothetical protein